MRQLLIQRIQIRKLSDTGLAGRKPEIHDGYGITGKEFTAVYILAIEILSLKVRELFLTALSISCRSTLTFPRHLDAIRIFLLQICQLFLDLPDLSGSVIQNFQLICCKLILCSFDRLQKKIAVIIIVSAYHLVLIDRQEQLFPELRIG